MLHFKGISKAQVVYLFLFIGVSTGQDILRRVIFTDEAPAAAQYNKRSFTNKRPTEQNLNTGFASPRLSNTKSSRDAQTNNLFNNRGVGSELTSQRTIEDEPAKLLHPNSENPDPSLQYPFAIPPNYMQFNPLLMPSYSPYSCDNINYLYAAYQTPTLPNYQLRTLPNYQTPALPKYQMPVYMNYQYPLPVTFPYMVSKNNEKTNVQLNPDTR